MGRVTFALLLLLLWLVVVICTCPRNVKAGDLQIWAEVPKIGYGTCLVEADSGEWVSPASIGLGVPVTTRRMIFKGRNLSIPTDTMTVVVPVFGQDSVGIAIDSLEIADGHPRVVQAFADNDAPGSPLPCGPEFLFVVPATWFGEPPEANVSLGFRSEFYTYDRWHDFKSFLFERQDSVVDFNWGAGAACSFCPLDYFSARFTTTVKIGVPGTYFFYVTKKDGARLWIDEVQGINSWSDGAGEVACSLAITQGDHAVKLEYYHGYSNANVKLEWSGPGMSRRLVQ